MAAEVGGGGKQGRAAKPEQDADAARAASAGRERGRVERQRPGVRGGVNEAGAPDAVAGGFGVGPVVRAGQRRRAGRREADADQARPGAPVRVAAEEVEQRALRNEPTTTSVSAGCTRVAAMCR